LSLERDKKKRNIESRILIETTKAPTSHLCTYGATSMGPLLTNFTELGKSINPGKSRGLLWRSLDTLPS